jgi:hypothetical protein
MSAIECEKILSGRNDLVAFGREVYMDLAHHNFYLSELPLNDHCRFPGHRSRSIDIERLETVSPTVTVGDLFERANPLDRKRNGTPHGTLSVPGQTLVTQVTCPRCGSRRPYPHLRVSLDASAGKDRTCCGTTMVATGFDDTNELRVNSLSPESIHCTLEDFGIRPHDIVCIHTSSGETRYFEVTREEVDHE